MEARAGLDRQLVDAEVAARVLERPLELGRPGGGRLLGAGRRSDRTRTGETGAPRASTAASASAAPCSRPRKRSAASSSACTPSETRLTPAVRKPARRAASTEVGLASSVISRSWAGAKRCARPLDHRGDGRGRHQGRRAAAEEDRGEPPRPDLVGAAVDLGDQGARPAGIVDRGSHVAVEVAVGALRPAERPVDVEPEAGVRQRRRIAPG